MSYHFCWISKHDPKVRKAFQNLTDLIREVQKEVRPQFTFKFYPVGSYKLNMMTFDKKSNKGFDFDINIEVNNDNLSPEKIHRALKQALDKIAVKYGYDFPEESTRVLTVKVKDRKHSAIAYSCDFAVVRNYEDEDGKEYQDYIRFDKNQNTFGWCQQSEGFYSLPEKISWIKENDLWQALMKHYIEKKNRNKDMNKHSRSLRAEAINDICAKYGFYQQEEKSAVVMPITQRRYLGGGWWEIIKH